MAFPFVVLLVVLFRPIFICLFVVDSLFCSEVVYYVNRLVVCLNRHLFVSFIVSFNVLSQICFTDSSIVFGFY